MPDTPLGRVFGLARRLFRSVPTPSNTGELNRQAAVAMARILRFACLASFILSGPVSAAGTLYPRETVLHWEAVEREGAEYREIFSEAVEASEKGDVVHARSLLIRITGFCESKKTSSDKTIVSAFTLHEFRSYTASLKEDVSVEWVDAVCPASYKMLAFLDVNAGDVAQALRHLQSATSMAPLWAEPHTEVGFIYNQLGEFEKARDAYMKAVRLADANEGSRYVKPMALRGVGYSLTELGDLDAAEDAYKESLQLEPGNEIAEHELKYIRALRDANN